jgi:hypothetical protein
MTRALTTAIKNALATNDIKPFHLLTINFATPVNFTDSTYSLTSSVSGTSVTYSPSSFIIGISDFSEEIDVTKSSVTISLSGANQTFISTVLNENIANRSVTIHRGLLDSNNAIISDPFLLYKGNIENFAINENTKSSVVNLSVVSHWADFEKKNGRKTNNTSQQRFFNTDVGMDFSSQTVLDIKWGRE